MNQVWNLLMEAQEKNLSLHSLAKLRESDPTGGVKPGAVHHWLHKYLSMYAARVALCYKNCLHFNLVTDASCHGCKDTLVSVSYSHENDCVAFAASQYVKSGKVVFPGEFNLATEVERICARREQERLHSYRFIQAISNQLLQLSSGNIQLESFVPAPHLCLEPLRPGDGIERRESGVYFLRHPVVHVSDENAVKQDLSQVQDLPLVTLLMDQGTTGMAAGAFMLSKNFLVHIKWDKIHRLVRDCKLAAKVAKLNEAIAMTSYAWSINYKPYGSGAFFEEKKAVLESFLCSESCEAWKKLTHFNLEPGKVVF